MANQFTVAVHQMNMQNDLSFPRVKIEPVWFSWHRFGGPDSCRIEISGSEELPLWEFMELLRYPITIFDPNSRPVWWGFLSSVELNLGNISASLSMDDIYNRVAVAYSLVGEGESAQQTRATTAWIQDDDSVSRYGSRELMLSLSKGSTVQATTLAQMTLAERSTFKSPNIRVGSAGKKTGTLTGRGWWSTLDWVYYADSNDAVIDNGTQLSQMLTGKQFFESFEITPALAGITSNRFRNGDTKALAEIEQLLDTGTSTLLRYNAMVDQFRNIRITLDPELTETNITVFQKRDGSVENIWGDAYQAQLCPVAKICQLVDVIPATLNISTFTNSIMYFIEAAEYNIVSGVYTPTPRNQSRAYDYATQLAEG